MPSFYGVQKGRSCGVFTSWKDCQQQIHRFKHAKYKKFATYWEAHCFVKGISEDNAKLALETPKGHSTPFLYPSWTHRIQRVYTDGSCIRKWYTAGVCGDRSLLWRG